MGGSTGRLQWLVRLVVKILCLIFHFDWYARFVALDGWLDWSPRIVDLIGRTVWLATLVAQNGWLDYCSHQGRLARW